MGLSSPNNFCTASDRSWQRYQSGSEVKHITMKSSSDLVNDSEDCSGEPAKVIFISATKHTMYMYWQRNEVNAYV